MGASESHGPFTSNSQRRASFGSVAEFHRRYEVGKKLGQGSFAQVRACHSYDKDHAVKIIDFGGAFETSHNPRIEKAHVDAELELWKLASGNKRIVQVYEAYSDDQLAYLVMEKCSGSVIDMLFTQTVDPLEGDVLGAVWQMLKALQHVHALGVAHRDVKPQNFLAGGIDGRTLKLCDFGVAALVPPKEGLIGSFGSPPYMSPEMVQGKVHGYATDMWSLGATAYYLLYGEFPHSPETKNSESMRSATARNYPPPRFEAVSGRSRPHSLAAEFVRRLLRRDVSARPTAEEALKCELMQNIRLGASKLLGNQGASLSRTPGRLSPIKPNSSSFLCFVFLLRLRHDWDL